MNQKTVPSDAIWIGGPLVSGRSLAAISLPAFHVPIVNLDNLLLGSLRGEVQMM